MFCPKCATQNVDGASFCRSCGANISLIPHALSGQLPTAEPDNDLVRKLRRKRSREPRIEEAIRSLMMGIAFIIISVLVGRYSPGGWTWWYWLLIPAFTLLGKGVSEMVRLKQMKDARPTFDQPQMTSKVRLETLSAPRTGELRQPVPSVTEGTTRHLGAEAPTKQFDSLESQKPS